MISILESVIIPATKCLKCHHLGKPRFSVQGRRRNLPKSLDAGWSLPRTAIRGRHDSLNGDFYNYDTAACSKGQ
jgi:hypothetical protein